MIPPRRGARAALRRVSLLPLALLLSACYSARYSSPRQPPILLFAETGFQLQLPLTDGTAGPVACTVIRARAMVQSIRGDTLLLARIEPLKHPYGAARCPELESAVVVTSNHPTLLAERVGVRGTETAVSTLLLAPVFLLGAMVLLLGFR